MSLHKKMAEGASWALLEKIGSQGISFVVFAIIARLVGPEEYGLVSLCYIYLALAYTLFTSMVDGVVNLHIRDDLRLSTLFWGVVASGFALGGLCFIAAVPFAAIMEQPRLLPLLRWFSLLPILFSFSAVPTILVTTSLNLKIFTIRTIVATLSGGIVGIVLALKGFGAYAIVAQQIVVYTVINIIIWPGSGWRPRFMFSSQELVNILKPGLKMSGSLFVTFTEQQIPRLLIGHFLGPVAVGHFAFVTRIRLSLQEVLIYPVSIVSYPAFARILKDTGEQKKILSILVALSGAIVFPSVIWAIVTAPIYVPLLFGAPWMPAIPVLQLFLITGACLPLLTILRDFLRAHNHMGAFLKMQLIIAVIGLIVTFLLVPHGLILMAQGLVVFSLLSMPVYVHLVNKQIKISLWRDCLGLWAPVAACTGMAGVLYLFNNSAFHSGQPWVLLMTDAVLGFLAYVVIYSLIQYRQVVLLLQFLKKTLKRDIGQAEKIEMIDDEVMQEGLAGGFKMKHAMPGRRGEK